MRTHYRRARAAAALLTSAAMLAQLVSYAPPAVAAKPAPCEMVERRTARSRVFDNGDGTYRYESFAEPIHYRDDSSGGWKAIESDLVRASDARKGGWRSKANAFTSALPEVIGSDWVSLETSRAVVAYRPAQDTVAVAGRRSKSETATVAPGKPRSLTYRSAFGAGVDLEYTSSATSLKETIVLDKYRWRNAFAFDLDTGTLEPRLMRDGGVGLYSAESTVPVWVIAAPFAEDSKLDRAGDYARTDKVAYELSRNGKTWLLNVVVDEAWLKAKERVWPIKIDPTFYFSTYQDYGTFQNNGYWATMDDYVTSAYPNNNYGGSTELKVGYYPGAGDNRSYVMPDVAHLMWLRQSTPIRVLDAHLNMNCTWRYNSTASDIYYGPIAGGWGEYGLTWNNQPWVTGTTGVAQVLKNTRTRFEIAPIVQTWMDTGNACGVAFWTYGGNVAHWTKFASREVGGPVFECLFTAPPVVSVSTPSLDTAVPAGAADLAVAWSFSDAWGKTQSGAAVEVRRAGADAVVSSVQATSESRAVLPTPPGGWAAGRYYVRVKAASGVAGYEVWSDWSAWQPFDVKPLGASVSAIGAEPYRAADAAGGASVDLATGRLLLSRTDFSAPALGGALGIGFTYDSARTASTGVGPGWRLAMPALGFDDQRAINPGFEAGSGTAVPTGWYAGPTAAVSRATTSVRTGSYALRLTLATAGDVRVHNSADAAGALVVAPGARLDAEAWAKAAGFSAGAGGGAVLEIAYYDDKGTLLSTAQSAPLVEADSTVWRKLALASVAPAAAHTARLGVALVNSVGSVYFDDVSFADGTLRLTDTDGTVRSFVQAGGGLYQRDPLVGRLALRRTNVARGIVPTVVGAGAATGQSTDGSYAIAASTGYDFVNAGTGAALVYDLREPKLLSEARIYLWDGSEATPRAYTYRLQWSNDNITYADLTAEISGARSWQTH